MELEFEPRIFFFFKKKKEQEKSYYTPFAVSNEFSHGVV